MAAPLKRHRTSLEGVIFPPSQCLAQEEHDEATKLFDRLMDKFEPSQASRNDYKPITLLRLTKEGVNAKDEFLILFFSFIEHERLGVTQTSLVETLVGFQAFQGWTSEDQNVLYRSLVSFAGYLMDNFFLPRMSLISKYLNRGMLTLLS